MKKLFSLFLLCACILHSSSTFSCPVGSDCILKNRSEDQECKLENTPLTRCEQFHEFVKEDKNLNDAYKSLQKLLNKNDGQQLKLAQRSWIKWRDDTCEDAEDNVGCNNGVCAGVEHDGCIVKLTRVRASELARFIENPVTAARSKFTYAKKYEGWLRY